jgi:hypothetical protein
MSSIFLKTELKNIMDTNSDTNVSLPKWINIVDISGDKNKKINTESQTSLFKNELKGGKYDEEDTEGFSATSSFMPNMLTGGGELSATSSFMPNNLKGGDSLNEKEKNNNDINKLISMLTSSESMSNTETDLLESKIKKTLTGGKISNNVNVADVKNFFLDLKQKGVNVNVQLDNQTMSEFFNNETTTNISDMFLNKQDGGKGPNAGFKAFLDLKKHVSTKLNIPNGPGAGSIAGVIQKEMKEKHKDMNSVDIAKEGMKHLDKNMEKYKAMVKK